MTLRLYAVVYYVSFLMPWYVLRRIFDTSVFGKKYHYRKESTWEKPV